MLLIFFLLKISASQANMESISHIDLLQKIQTELIFGNCKIGKFSSNLETIANHPIPKNEPEKSAFFLLKRALKDVRKIEDLAKNDKAKYLALMDVLLLFNYNNLLTALSSSGNVKQGLLLKQYDENIQKIRPFFGEKSFTEFSFRRSLLIIRTEEMILASENRIKSTCEISKTLDYFDDPEWTQNLFFNILKNYLSTAPLSNIPTNKKYLESLNDLNLLLKIRYKDPLIVQCVIKFRRMNYYFKNKNPEEAIRIFKTLPIDFYEDDQGVKEINPLIFVDILNLASQIYWDSGNKELAKTYQEISFSICSSKINNEKDFTKKRTLIVAEKLREYYLMDKNLNLIRGLEGRSEKYGMKPLSKQPGEN
jgi:hypothetical protein